MKRFLLLFGLLAAGAISSPLKASRTVEDSDCASPSPAEPNRPCATIASWDYTGTPSDDGDLIDDEDSPFNGRQVLTLNWDVTWKRVKVPGLNQQCKDMMVINDAWPPPSVAVSKGTVIVINLSNSLTGSDHYFLEDISLHAHGLLQKRNMWMDGPVGVTQKGIPPGKQFQYIWDTEDEDSGTYWIHSHVKAQYPKGLRLPLIIRDSNTEKAWWPAVGSGSSITRREWDTSMDYVMTLSDWFLGSWTTVERKYICNLCGNGLEVPPDRALINDGATTNLDLRTTNNKSGRIRIINTSAFSPFFVYVQSTTASENIRLQVIETDGVPMDGTGIFQVLEVAPGQRVSVLVDPDGRGTNRNYPLVAAINSQHYRSVQLAGGQCARDANAYESWHGWTDSNFITYDIATLQLGTKPSATAPAPANTPSPTWPSTLVGDNTYRLCFPWLSGQSNCASVTTSTSPKMYTIFNDFDDLLLKPKFPPADASIPPSGSRYVAETSTDNGRANLRIIAEATRDRVNDESVGYYRYQQQDEPALKSIMTRNWNSVTQWPAATNPIHILPNQNAFWLVIYSNVGAHPFHLHGHTFQVVYRQREQVASSNSDRQARLNRVWDSPSFFTTPVAGVGGTWAADGTNPPRRDTIMVYKNAMTVLRVTADNPGAWFFHCHNDFHAMTGMAAQIVEHQQQVRDMINGFAGTDEAWKSARYAMAVGDTPFPDAD